MAISAEAVLQIVGKFYILRVMKKLQNVPEEKPETLYYEVVYHGKVVFTDECYAICNSYICRNMLQGVRPKGVRPKAVYP